METSVESQPYLGNSDSLEQSNFTEQEIKPPMSFPLLIIIFPLLMIMAFLVAIIKIFTKDAPI